MQLQTARGVQDIPPEEKILKNQVVSTLQETFEIYGFAPLETPIIERYETLAAKFGAGTGSDVLKETFRFKDQGKRDLGLRFELTTSLGRFIALNPNLKMPFKRYELGPVFRDGPIKAGRVRQFWQCDVDTIGSSNMLADAEILALTKTVFDKLKLDVEIKVNNRKLLNGILEQAGIKKKDEAIIAVDKLDKIGEKGVTAELKERGFKDKEIKELLKILTIKNRSQLKKQITTEEGKQGLEELEQLLSYLKEMKVKVTFDLSLARGLSYYTGTVFEVFAKKGPITSSLAGGGRWDKMIGNFLGGNREIPAVGIAFGIVPIMEVLKAGKELKERTSAQVYVIPIKTTEKSLVIVEQLREKGIKADFDLQQRGLSKNLNYANSLGIPYAIIIGENELKQSKLLLRDMQTGDQQLLSLSDVVKRLK
ncbi:MAG: histidine--tRNA ligase [Candidatus Woesearchaeota archaeon]